MSERGQITRVPCSPHPILSSHPKQKDFILLVESRVPNILGTCVRTLSQHDYQEYLYSEAKREPLVGVEKKRQSKKMIQRPLRLAGKTLGKR